MTRRMRIDDLTDLAVPSQPALSPDGSRVVYVLRTLDAEQDRNVDQLWSVPAAGGTARRLTTGSSDTAPAWSPDGTRLAFLRESQLHVLAADGGEPEQVTDLPLGAGAPVWSPNGERIAFTSPVNPVDPTDGPTGTQRPWSRRASTTRPTVPGCSARRAASCTWSTSPPATAAGSPTVTTPASPPGRRTAAPLPSPARSAPTAT